MKIEPSYVTAYTLSSALGVGNEAHINSLRKEAGGLSEMELGFDFGSTWYGHVDRSQLDKVSGELACYDNACSRLIQTALNQDDFITSVERVKERYGSHRVACFMGTIVSGVVDLEENYLSGRERYQKTGHPISIRYGYSMDALVQFTRKYLGVQGAYATIGTACSSSAKVFATASRYLQAGLCDAAIVAGAESFNQTLIHGFRSFNVLASEPCKPWGIDRTGINVGAAAGFALLEREPNHGEDILLCGYGESADAYHMTAPHPEGEGIEKSMLDALGSAGLEPKDIDYINVHGSGTPLNDGIEDAAIARIFGKNTLCSSTKGWTGHTQGAAGITEAIILMLSIQESLAPATLNTQILDPDLVCNISLENVKQDIQFGLTNSMGFGGSNATLIFGAPQ